jgi:hypothetical protein
MVPGQKEAIAEKQPPSEAFKLPMPLDCTICMAMSGNGVSIVGTIIMKERQGMLPPGSPMEIGVDEYSEGVRGTSAPENAVLPIG